MKRIGYRWRVPKATDDDGWRIIWEKFFAFKEYFGYDRSTIRLFKVKIKDKRRIRRR